jgi:hypothetical protein
MPQAATAKSAVAGEPDLLADIASESQDTPTVETDEDFDLLANMSESDATAWIP